MQATDWAAQLLADDSDASLLIWADWLEDQGDPACQGVREFLVAEVKRPVYGGMEGGKRWYRWWPQKAAWIRDGDDLDIELCVLIPERPDFSHRTLRIYNVTDKCSRAEAKYAALYDAATAWVKANAPPARSPA